MKIKKNLTELLISIGIILIILSSSDPILYPDSSRYLEGSLDDPPLYSLLIKIILSVFENLNCVIIFQSFLVGVSIIFSQELFRLNLI